jgi:hypothetical protein
VLLVGAYPASEDDDDTFDLITSILKQGVTKFVCLQSEVRVGSYRCWVQSPLIPQYVVLSCLTRRVRVCELLYTYSYRVAVRLLLVLTHAGLPNYYSTKRAFLVTFGWPEAPCGLTLRMCRQLSPRRATSASCAARRLSTWTN